MIRPIRGSHLPSRFTTSEREARAFPRLDRAFDAVEDALARLGLEDPQSLRSPKPVEEALSPTALPDGALLILSQHELRAAEIDLEDTVKDERQGGSVFVSLPGAAEMTSRARGLRELGSVASTFGFRARGAARVPTRLGRVEVIEAPANLQPYRFVLADTPGFRVALVSRALPGGGFVALWLGSGPAYQEVRDVLSCEALGQGLRVPGPSPEVPPLEEIDSEKAVWAKAKDLRDYRVVREAELREIARAAALRGVALRREREAKKRAAASA